MSRKDRVTKAQIVDGFRLLALDNRLIEPYTNASEFAQDLIEKLHGLTCSESIRLARTVIILDP